MKMFCANKKCVGFADLLFKHWIPACAGMTDYIAQRYKKGRPDVLCWAAGFPLTRWHRLSSARR
jgi:hypothetical protein